MASLTGERDDLLNRLRQQLILAQVRVMEIEDERDATTARLAETEHLLVEAQRLADAKLDEAAHLERVRADLQIQFDHLRHQQHLTNQALEQVRAQLAQVEISWRNEQEVTTGLQLQLVAQNAALRTAEQRNVALETESTARATRIAELDREQRTMKDSRSWRWTAWLRSLERAFGARR